MNYFEAYNKVQRIIYTAAEAGNCYASDFEGFAYLLAKSDEAEKAFSELKDNRRELWEAIKDAEAGLTTNISSPAKRCQYMAITTAATLIQMAAIATKLTERPLRKDPDQEQEATKSEAEEL